MAQTYTLLQPLPQTPPKNIPLHKNAAKWETGLEVEIAPGSVLLRESPKRVDSMQQEKETRVGAEVADRNMAVDSCELGRREHDPSLEMQKAVCVRRPVRGACEDVGLASVEAGVDIAPFCSWT